jgi:hypothetical protein
MSGSYASDFWEPRAELLLFCGGSSSGCCSRGGHDAAKRQNNSTASSYPSERASQDRRSRRPGERSQRFQHRTTRGSEFSRTEHNHSWLDAHAALVRISRLVRLRPPGAVSRGIAFGPTGKSARAVNHHSIQGKCSAPSGFEILRVTSPLAAWRNKSTIWLAPISCCHVSEALRVASSTQGANHGNVASIPAWSDGGLYANLGLFGDHVARHSARRY